MALRVPPLVALTGCHFATPGLADGGGGDDAATGETGVDGPPNPTCFGTGLERVCLADLPSMPLTISADTAIDTDASLGCAVTTSSTVPVCVLAGTTITVTN